MKTLYLIRHAKSSWDDFSLKDIERPLNERGKRDAPDMAHRLLKKKSKIELCITSPAKRAVSTCKYFAEVFDIKKKRIIKKEDLYLADINAFNLVIENIDNDYDSVAIFSHNPGITAFANSLTNTHIDDMPTCSVFAVEFDLKKWKNFQELEKSFLFFDYPKNTDISI